MNALLTLLLLVQPARVDSKFEQVRPEPPLGKLMARSEGQERAVVLIHGLHPHPFNSENVTRPAFRDWQAAEARLPRELVLRADVFAFAYAQDVPVDDVAASSSLAEDIATLRKMGYRDITLIGHSAGGLVARQFVEDHPEAGVTRVIQVRAPNGGSNWAKFPGTVRKNQVAFLKSLTKDGRKKSLEARKDKVIPAGVQFVTVVGTGTHGGDGVVLREAQWPADLQKQGIPVVTMDVTHPTAMRGQKSVEMIAKLVTEDYPRWTVMRVAQARKELLPHAH